MATKTLIGNMLTSEKLDGNRPSKQVTRFRFGRVKFGSGKVQVTQILF